VRSRWLPIAGYAVVSSANQMLWLTYAPITTGAAHHYHVSVSTVGWLAEVFPLLYVVLALPSGALLDRWFRPGLAAGAVLTAVGAVIRPLSGGFGAVLIGQILIALAQPLVLNAVTKLAGEYLRPADRSTGISVSSAAIFAGMVLALLLGAVLGDHRIPLLLDIQTGYAVLAAVLLCFALRRPGGHFVADADNSGLRAVWADRYVRRLVVMVFAGFGVFVALTTWLQALLEPAGVSESTAGVLLLVMVVAGVAGSAVLPPVLARRGIELRFIAGSVIAAAAGCVVLALAPGVVTGFVVVAVIGVLLLTDLPVLLELTAHRVGAAAGTATGLLWMSGNAGGLLVAAAVQGLVPHPVAAFCLLAVVAAGALPAIRGARPAGAYPDRPSPDRPELRPPH
jgi:predicted MFS family arabinose efflux permease